MWSRLSPEQTIEWLARDLELRIATNDARRLLRGQSQTRITRFHARTIPSIDLRGYLSRILKYAPCSPDCFLATLVYLERISVSSTTSSTTGSLVGDDGDDGEQGWVTQDIPGQPRHLTKHKMVLSSYNIHRLLIAGTLIAVKFLSDVFYTNLHMSRTYSSPLCLKIYESMYCMYSCI